MKQSPEEYESVLLGVRSALGFPLERKPLLIGVDGLDGAGKSSFASWLSWQLEMPAVHLDLYLVQHSRPLSWRFDDLQRVLEARQRLGRPVICEGILLLTALQHIGRRPDVLIYVEMTGNEGTRALQSELASYQAEFSPRDSAHYHLRHTSDTLDDETIAASVC
jgi:hypothetical protein